MLCCILTGGNIDLSVGSLVILVGGIAGIFMEDWGMNPYLTIVLALVISTLIGAWQAFWIAYVRIPPFVTTLAGMLMFRGLAVWLMDSKGKSRIPDGFKDLFNTFLPGASADSTSIMITAMGFAIAVCLIFVATQIFSRAHKARKGYAMEPLSAMLAKIVVICAVILFLFWRIGSNGKGVHVLLIWLSAIVLIYTYFTQNTIPGRYLYAMGGTEKAARLSGVNTKRMMFFAYTNMGFLAGVTALVCVAREGQASTQLGVNFELDAIGACFIGGASAYGGVGKISGAVIGAVFIGVLNMGMSIYGVDTNLQRVVKGLVLLAAVIFDLMSKNRKQAA
jgi:putative multiple sugar transport system permease protein